MKRSRAAALLCSCVLVAACDAASFTPEPDAFGDALGHADDAPEVVVLPGRARAAGVDVAEARRVERLLAEETARAAALPPVATACEDGWRLLASGEHLALASSREVWASADGGRTFQRVMAARASLDEVTLTSTGTVVARVDGRHRAVLADGEVVAIGAAPRAATGRGAKLQAAGDWLAWTRADASAVWASRDFGATWTRRALPDIGSVGASVSLGEDGALDVISGYEASCGGGAQWWYRLRLEDGERQDLRWPLDTPWWRTTARGVAVAGCIVEDGAGAHVAPCVVSAGGAVARLDAPELTEDDVDAVEVRPALGAAVAGRLVFEWAGGSAEAVAYLPEGGQLVGRGADGRLLASDGVALLALDGGAWREVARLPEGCPAAQVQVAMAGQGGVVAVAGAQAFRWDGERWERTLPR